MKIDIPDSKSPTGFTSTQIDEQDLPLFGLHNWRIITHYANTESQRKDVSAWTGNKRIWLSREILNAPKGLEADHINGDPLDNRRENLRLLTRQQNMFNRRNVGKSGYAGVYIIGNKPVVRVTSKSGRLIFTVNGANNDLEAAHIYNALAKFVHGDKAYLNNLS